MTSLLRALLAFALLAFASLLTPAVQAQTFPKLTGQVVDDANLLDPAQEQALTAKLAALNTQSGRQLVVATIPDLQGYDIADYGYRLGRAWGIGSKDKNDGSLLIVAPNERKLRIEAGYGVEGILTDAMSSRIIRNAITPRFKAKDFAGGINAGVDQIAQLLTLPPDQATALARKVAQEDKKGGAPNMMMAIIIVIIFFVVLRGLFNRSGGRSYSSDAGPVILWGPTIGGGGGGGGWGSGGGWGGGDGGGGFSGGGGSFGGGGASGDW
ncbi:hypothetical protein BH10PSE12_BH10PSE12_19940 [soil metagenome]